VLVEDESAKGHPDAIPFSDGRSYRKFFIPVSECTPVD
jgi:hypothetical protein